VVDLVGKDTAATFGQPSPQSSMIPATSSSCSTHPGVRRQAGRIAHLVRALPSISFGQVVPVGAGLHSADEQSGYSCRFLRNHARDCSPPVAEACGRSRVVMF
jgi:hypothetical protein